MICKADPENLKDKRELLDRFEIKPADPVQPKKAILPLAVLAGRIFPKVVTLPKQKITPVKSNMLVVWVLAKVMPLEDD